MDASDLLAWAYDAALVTVTHVENFSHNGAHRDSAEPACRGARAKHGITSLNVARLPTMADGSPDIAAILIAAQSPDASIRGPAEQQIETAKASNLVCIKRAPLLCTCWPFAPVPGQPSRPHGLAAATHRRQTHAGSAQRQQHSRPGQARSACTPHLEGRAAARAALAR